MTGEQITVIAKVVHDANKSYCETLGDTSQPAWEDAPQWQKASGIGRVKFHLENPDAGPIASHNNWLSEIQAAGWIYGPVKDPEKKTHPCMVPYKFLPIGQQGKDLLFVSILTALTYEGDSLW